MRMGARQVGSGLKPPIILEPLGKPGVCPPHMMPWHPEEDELLMTLYKSMTTREIEPQFPGRTLFSIRNRIDTLRERMPEKVEKKQRRYTWLEERFIRRNCATMSCKDIGKHLNRSEVGVRMKGYELGVIFRKCGEYAPGAKYPDALVRQIRELREQENLSFKAVAAKTGLSVKVAQKLYYLRLTSEDRIREDMLPR